MIIRISHNTLVADNGIPVAEAGSNPHKTLGFVAGSEKHNVDNTAFHASQRVGQALSSVDGVDSLKSRVNSAYRLAERVEDENIYTLAFKTIKTIDDQLVGLKQKNAQSVFSTENKNYEVDLPQEALEYLASSTLARQVMETNLMTGIFVDGDKNINDEEVAPLNAKLDELGTELNAIVNVLVSQIDKENPEEEDLYGCEGHDCYSDGYERGVGFPHSVYDDEYDYDDYSDCEDCVYDDCVYGCDGVPEMDLSFDDPKDDADREEEDIRFEHPHAESSENKLSSQLLTMLFSELLNGIYADTMKYKKQ